MSRRTALLFTAAMAIAAGPAWAQKVTTDFDPSVNFSVIRMYYWAKVAPTQNDLMNQRIIAAVDHWLTAKGWVKSPEGQADVAVIPHVTTQQGQRLSTFCDGLGGWGFGGWGAGLATTTVETYTEGTLIVDLFATRTKKLVWRGTATDTLSDDPTKIADRIQKAAEKMFKNKFPPGVQAVG